MTVERLCARGAARAPPLTGVLVCSPHALARARAIPAGRGRGILETKQKQTTPILPPTACPHPSPSPHPSHHRFWFPGQLSPFLQFVEYVWTHVCSVQDPAKLSMGSPLPRYLQFPRIRNAVAAAELRNSTGAPLEMWMGLQAGEADVEVVRGAFLAVCATML